MLVFVFVNPVLPALVLLMCDGMRDLSVADDLSSRNQDRCRWCCRGRSALKFLLNAWLNLVYRGSFQGAPHEFDQWVGPFQEPDDKILESGQKSRSVPFVAYGLSADCF